MKPPKTRFSYVYEDLKRRIVSGQLQPGSKLPSSRNLCKEYNVGIATIKRVLDTLKSERLIDIQMRQTPVVLSQNLKVLMALLFLSSGIQSCRYMKLMDGYCLICLYPLHIPVQWILCLIIGRLKKQLSRELLPRAGKL